MPDAKQAPVTPAKSATGNQLEAARAAAKAKRETRPETETEKRIAVIVKLKEDGKATDADLKLLSDLYVKKNKEDLARLGSARVEKAVKALRAIKVLSRLKPSEKQRKQVIAALQHEVEAIDAAWEGAKPAQDASFSLEKD